MKGGREAGRKERGNAILSLVYSDWPCKTKKQMMNMSLHDSSICQVGSGKSCRPDRESSMQPRDGIFQLHEPTGTISQNLPMHFRCGMVLGGSTISLSSFSGDIAWEGRKNPKRTNSRMTNP